MSMMPIASSSRCQTSIQTSSYGAEFMAGKTACAESISIQHMLRSLGVAIKGWTNLYGDHHQGMLRGSMLIDAECKKWHVPIAYHKMREYVTAGTINPIKVLTDHIISDFLAKALEWGPHHHHTGCFFGRWQVVSQVNMSTVQL